MNLSKYQVDGFQLLEEVFETSGYDKHLESRKRSRLAKRSSRKCGRQASARSVEIAGEPGDRHVPTPAGLDLMMWAVLIGEDQLARPALEARRTSRCAARSWGARVANKIAAELGRRPSQIRGVEKQAQQYEQWAIGVLDEIKETTWPSRC